MVSAFFAEYLLCSHVCPKRNTSVSTASISYVDEHVGAILAVLEEESMTEKTMV
jgi:arylsulfatase A-like enzyme